MLLETVVVVVLRLVLLVIVVVGVVMALFTDAGVLQHLLLLSHLVGVVVLARTRRILDGKDFA